jgi:hypothetical protein
VGDIVYSRLGCLGVSAIALVALVSVGWLFWDVPTGLVTDAGDQVLVKHYIKAANPFQVFFDRPDEAPARAPDQPQKTEERIGAETFELLKPGRTTYSILADYLRAEADLQSSSDLGGVKTESYLIRNANGSSVYLIFQDGVLVSKSQHGLQ